MPLLLVVAFILVPIVEIAVILQVGDWLGVWPTIALLVIDSVVGSWLLRREGRSAWRRFRVALDSARIPSTEVIDGALVLFGGALMLTPGFVTDLFGIMLILPPSRAVLNRAIRSRVRGVFGLEGNSARRTVNRPPGATTGRRRASEDVVEVEVVNVERTKSTSPDDASTG